jgi:hypothetical protein
VLAILETLVAFDERTGVIPAKGMPIAVVGLSEPAVVEVRAASDGDGNTERVLNVAFLTTGPTAISRRESTRVEPAKAIWVGLALDIDADIGLRSVLPPKYTYKNAEGIFDLAIAPPDITAIAFAPAVGSVSSVGLAEVETFEEVTAQKTLAEAEAVLVISSGDLSPETTHNDAEGTLDCPILTINIAGRVVCGRVPFFPRGRGERGEEGEKCRNLEHGKGCWCR